jgi:hypothetical protein
MLSLSSHAARADGSLAIGGAGNISFFRQNTTDAVS